MEIIKEGYFDVYRQQLNAEPEVALLQLTQQKYTHHDFTFYTSVAVISSSRIEGEQMEVDSYVQHKMQDIEYLPELVEKPNDLYSAYTFAQQNELSKGNFLASHQLIAAHLLPEKWRGAYRKNEMLVMEHNTGRIQYEAARFSIIAQEMDKLWRDIEWLNDQQLSTVEIFYYAAFIHLVFVNIHPFNDGNGRAARLLEKWFLAKHIGEKAWYIPSERYYYRNVDDYYRNLHQQGQFYDTVDYERALPFLLMLPKALTGDK